MLIILAGPRCNGKTILGERLTKMYGPAFTKHWDVSTFGGSSELDHNRCISRAVSDVLLDRDVVFSSTLSKIDQYRELIDNAAAMETEFQFRLWNRQYNPTLYDNKFANSFNEVFDYIAKFFTQETHRIVVDSVADGSYTINALPLYR